MASIFFNCFSISNAHNVKPTTVLSRSPNALLPNQWSSRPSPLVPNSGPSVEEITVTYGPLILHLATEVALECTSTSSEPTYALPSRPRQKQTLLNCLRMSCPCSSQTLRLLNRTCPHACILEQFKPYLYRRKAKSKVSVSGAMNSSLSSCPTPLFGRSLAIEESNRIKTSHWLEVPARIISNSSFPPEYLRRRTNA